MSRIISPRQRTLLRRVITAIVTVDLFLCVVLSVAMGAVFFYFLYYLVVLSH